MKDERPEVAKGETVCPACAGRLVPIVYGLPSPEGVLAADRGEVALSGCIVSAHDPRLKCQKCRQDYWMAVP